MGIGGALAKNCGVRLLQPVIHKVHEHLYFIKSRLIFLNEIRNGLAALVIFGWLVGAEMQFHFSLPLLAYGLKLASFVHVAQFGWRLFLQCLEVILALAEVFGDAFEELLKFGLDLGRLGHLLARSQLLLRKVKLLETRALLAEWRLDLDRLVLIVG